MAVDKKINYKEDIGFSIVKPSKDGKRPGYRSAQFQSARAESMKSGRSKKSNPNMGGGGGRDASTTSFDKSINPNRPGGPIGRDDSGVPGPDRSKVSQFSQYGKNVMNRNLDPTLKFDPRTGGMKKSFTGGLGSLLGTILGFVTGNPFVSLALGGFDRIKRFNDKIQNTDFGRSTSFKDYMDMKSYGGYDEREEARRLNMEDAKRIQGLIDSGKFGLPTSNRERNILGIPSTNAANDFASNFIGGSIPFNPGMTVGYGDGIVRTSSPVDRNVFNFSEQVMPIGLSTAQKQVLNRPDVRFNVTDSTGIAQTEAINNILNQGSGFKNLDDPNDPATATDIRKFYGLPV